MIFSISLFSVSLSSLLTALFLLIFVKGRDGVLFKKCESLPRAKASGAVLAVCVIAWCIPNIRPIINSDMLNTLLIPLAVLSAILSIVFLDYLFARAFGVFLILMAHYFLKESYSVNPNLHSLFSILTLIAGTFGICICGKPYWFRDVIRKFFDSQKWRISTAVFLIVYSLICAYIAIQSFG